MLFKISTASTRPNDAFDLISVPAGTHTLLQFKALDNSAPCISEWGLTLVGDAGFACVELVETDSAATVTLLQDEDVIRVDKYALDAQRLGNQFDLDAEDGRGTGHSASDEGVIESVRSLDAVVVPVNSPIVRQFPSVVVGSRVEKRAPYLKPQHVARLRVKCDRPLLAHAWMVLDF
jgi:hypothetical protein